MGMIKLSTSIAKILWNLYDFGKKKLKVQSIDGETISKVLGKVPAEQKFYRNIPLGFPVVISGLLLFHSCGHSCCTLMHQSIQEVLIPPRANHTVFTQCSRSVRVSDCFVINKIQFTLSFKFIYLQVMKKYLKLRKTPLKPAPTSFSSPRWTSQSLTKASSFLINQLIHLLETRVSIAPGSPRGTLMHSPRGHNEIANAAQPPGPTA